MRLGVGLAKSTGHTVAASYPAPVLSGVSPATGAVGTSVTLTGTSFRPGMMVKFGAVQAPASYVADGQFTCTVPTLAAAAYAVTITGPGGTSGSRTFTVV